MPRGASRSSRCYNHAIRDLHRLPTYTRRSTTEGDSMTTLAVSATDLSHVLSLLLEFQEAGRTDEAAALARVYSTLQAIALAEFDVDDDDPEFVHQMEEAERDIAEGRLIPHDEVLRRLQALDDG